MSKPNGRGRGWRRKATWADLAPSTQKKYLRSGIGPAERQAGLTPHQVNQWIRYQERVYGWEHEGGREYSVTVNGVEHRGEIPRGAELVRLVKEQKQAQAAYHAGDTDRGRAIWESRDPDVPEFMYYYHGLFN